MAGHTPYTTPQPRPLPRHTRTAGDILKAALAALALLALLIAVPAALVYFVGWPLPDSLPSLSTLQQPITLTTFIDVLTVVVWLAWAQFTACVFVEVKAALSGVGLPTQIPGAGPSQLMARQLIAALLLLSASAASLAPSLSGPSPRFDAPPRNATTATAQQTPGQQHRSEQASHRTAAREGRHTAEGSGVKGTATPHKGAKSTKFYRIQPPEGRHHDSLWEIAQRHLDDGRRYKEIYELNKDRLQPDGSRLSLASLIRPGWIVEMPGDAHGGDLVEMPDEAPKVDPEVREQITAYEKTSTTKAPHHGENDQHGGQQAQQGKQADQGNQQPAEHVTPPAPSHASPAHRPTAPAPSATVQDTPAIGLPEALLAAPLLAAGLLAALGRRRRTALWDAAARAVHPGRHRIPVPTGPAANAQDALLVGADPEAVRHLDLALRGLTMSLTEAGRTLPTIYAAWLTDTELHLQLTHAAGQPPAPWTLGQNDMYWRLERAAVPQLRQEDGTAAPYPGLVSLGTLNGARLLLNLESVPGIVALTGTPTARTAVLASIAAELATNGWSDRMTVTLVGFGDKLPALAPTRLRHLPDVEALVETMNAETEHRRRALAAAGHDTVLIGRTGRTQHAQSAPHLVLLGCEPTPDQAQQLATLAADSGRLGIGYLLATAQTDLPGANWQLEITPEGRLVAPLLGLDLEAQLLPADQHDAIVQLFTQATPSDDGPDPSAPAPAIDITGPNPPAVYARIIGPYDIRGLDTPQAERSALLHEGLALLLLHREGVHPRVLASALWPRGVTQDVVDAFIARLRTWLGSDPDGAIRLTTDSTGRLKLTSSVVSDWDVLQALHEQANTGPGASVPAVRERFLTDALALARGPLLADRPEGRYAWLANEIVDGQLRLLIADTALALATHHQESNNPQAASTALEAALATAPNDERLWHELLRAVHATSDTARLEAVTRRLLAHHNPARGLPPQTQALLDELMPAWNARTAN
ncbi:BTAD domain-containing putative transcriptional regulator [Streptomyces natalensis]|uniref:Membrane protein n=1 Tax=Streptomyces natalensis ATCC 27448 TaxID=1240678 RepID=A0A0D7CGU8_9ACTN|nr:BTAD domain-containing putative transcriptional regulator [Streptomyces natalensis]KIZ15413.1 membrane protein [Streptomyces natalensis ATCC 27448]